MRHKIMSFLGLLAITSMGCSEKLPTAPQTGTRSTAAASAFAVSPTAPGVKAARYSGGAVDIQGETGPGALYRMAVPDGWNGDLILYAHGYIEPQLSVGLPTRDDIEELTRRFLALGYGVAYSSYSETGYALKDAALRTNQLRALFVAKFGTPNHIYLAGHSLGGIVVVKLAEQYPDLYDGAIPMSGVLGGTKLEVDYIANVRVLFDLFYPGVLPGNVESMPTGIDPVQGIALPAIQAIKANPQGAFFISQMTQTPISFQSSEELVGTIVQGLVFHAIELDDLTGRTHGHPFFDNSATVYTGALPQPVLDDVNARVGRFHASPDALTQLRNYYEPTGDLRVPMLALHTCRDPLIPAFHVDAYAQRVKRPELFARRMFDRYGHSLYDPDEVVTALQDLAHWVTTGERPVELACGQAP